MKDKNKSIEGVAEELAYQIVHSEEGFYEPVYQRVLKTITSLVQQSKEEAKEEMEFNLENTPWQVLNPLVYN